MIVKIIISVGVLFLIGGILIICDHRSHSSSAAARKSDWLKYIIYIVIIGVFLAAAFNGKTGTGLLLILIAFTGGIELTRNGFLSKGFLIAIFGASVIIIFSALAHLLFLAGGDWSCEFAYVFLLIAVTDSYSQLWGKLLGKRKLCPALSPRKTRAGFFGGLISAVTAGLFLDYLSLLSEKPLIIAYALAIALAANAGDLFFSLIKRRLGIKDFSGIIPGHGGILDRFDSLIVAAPAAYWTRILINN